MSAQQPSSSADIAGYTGGSVIARAGQFVRVVDVEGVQIGDLFAVATGNHDEFISPSVTRLHNRNLFPHVGQSFFTTDDRPILTFTRDHSPGFHDMLFASCNAKWFAGRGMDNHPNCRDNYFAAARAAGIDHAVQPDPVNIFQNTPPGPDGTFFVGVTMSEPGDFVTLRVDLDCIVILTACSSERVLGGKSTPMRLDVYDRDPD
ncbi:MAG: urea carboxylase-associated family protein [Alphaproteobacteria bacterium]